MRQPDKHARAAPGAAASGAPARETLIARLQLSEARYRALAEASSQIAWITDAQGLVEEDNPSWRAYTGQSYAEMRGMGWLAAIHPDDRATTQAAWEAARCAGALYRHEHRIRRYDGVYRLFHARGIAVRDPSGTVREWVGFCNDITDRQQLLDELAERVGQLEVILSSISDGVYVCDTQGVIRYANPAFHTILGLQSEEIFAQTFSERAAVFTMRNCDGTPLAPDTLPVARVLHGATLTQDTSVDAVVTGQDGRTCIVNITGAPLRNRQGAITGAVMTLRDVTAQREAEQERLHLLDIVAHELKTPLTTMKLAAQLVHRHIARGSLPNIEYTQRLEVSIERMRRTVDDLLEVAHFGKDQLALHVVPTDVTALCRQVADEQMAATERGLHLDLPKRRIMAEVDASRLAQVVGNLLSNALKYTPPTADVWLSVKRHGKENVCITVRDAGPGIVPDALPHLFERFYRAPGAQVLHGGGKGLGLGLFICRMLVEAHGGTITVTSVVGRGTTFTALLPLKSPRASDA
jgi:PAS domain S-box-containing protein